MSTFNNYNNNEKEQNKQNVQVLIEDGTMASFGLNNTSEVKVKDEDKKS